MHVGWAAAFAPPRMGETPRFAELRDHIERRLCRAPRYRQKLARVPFGLNSPTWVDDEAFDVNRHVVASSSPRLEALVDECMSSQLPRDKPLWQMCVADRLDDGRIGVVGKAHHCMVDGIAAVELASLLLDPSADPETPDDDQWRPQRGPGAARRTLAGMLDRIRDQGSLLGFAGRLAGSPQRLNALPAEARRAGLALAHAASRTEPVHPLNQPISPARHLAGFWRPLGDLKRIARAHGATVNDVLLAVSAGGARRLLQRRDQQPIPLRAMVPVSVRVDGEADDLGNRISFVFIDLPCDEPDPIRRLRAVQAAMSERKEDGDPAGAEVVLGAVKFAPRILQRAISRLAASPRTFNLVVSNIPGPREPMYMAGCELEEAYPVVPLADQHALSIGMTTIRDRACFGIYTDREALPDADRFAIEVDAAIEELSEARPRLRSRLSRDLIEEPAA
jgi:WS/DGAT/MGAT family acyltransferase